MFYYGVKSKDHIIDMATRICAALGNGKNNAADKLMIETTCAESQLAQYQDPTPNGAGRGLTQVDYIAWVDVVGRTRKKDKDIIEQVFGIVIDANSSHQSLDHDPLLALIICRLHYKLVEQEIPADLPGRAQYWKDHYNKTGKGTPEHYIESVITCDPFDDQSVQTPTQPEKKEKPMFGAITTAYSLAKSLGLTNWLDSKFEGSGESIQVAEKVIDVVKAVTGDKTESALLHISKDPIMAEKIKTSLIENEHEIDKLAFADRQSARDMYDGKHQQADKIADNIMTWNLPMIIFMVVVQVASIHYLGDQGAVLGVISNVIGMVLNALINERQQVSNFFFGSSLGSKLKNKPQ